MTDLKNKIKLVSFGRSLLLLPISLLNFIYSKWTIHSAAVCVHDIVINDKIFMHAMVVLGRVGKVSRCLLPELWSP